MSQAYAIFSFFQKYLNSNHFTEYKKHIVWDSLRKTASVYIIRGVAHKHVYREIVHHSRYLYIIHLYS